MYGHWVGLDEKKIHYIKRAKTRTAAWKRLKESLPRENIYYIQLSEKEIIARKRNKDILIAENGNRYKIV